MGPRNRRRLAIGVAALVVIAAIVVGVVTLTGSSPKQTQPGRPGEIPNFEHHYVGPTDARYDKNSQAVIFGMTARQVLRIVGPPTKKVRNCWQYRVNEYVSGAGQHSTFNADRLCFYEGKYSEKHSETNGQWDYQAPLPDFTQ